jgi:hypothetical protein
MGLEGTWHNELGSTLIIASVAGGEIRGTYETAVSSTGCAKGAFPLSGRVDPGSQADQPLGFVVAWVNGQSQCDSATAWSGQYQLVGLDPPYQEQIFTTWLLTQHHLPAGKLGFDARWPGSLPSRRALGERDCRQFESPAPLASMRPCEGWPALDSDSWMAPTSPRAHRV